MMFKFRHIYSKCYAMKVIVEIITVFSTGQKSGHTFKCIIHYFLPLSTLKMNTKDINYVSMIFFIIIQQTKQFK